MNAELQTQAKARINPSVTPAPANLLQRKCACGNHTIAGGECEECRDKDEVRLQRAAVNSEGVQKVPPIVHEVLRLPGQPLDANTRAFFEPRLGHDFSQVRVHTDAKATKSARAVNSLAYTVGRDVVFGLGQYQPGARIGQRLLAHELVHVVQQTAGGWASIPARLTMVGDEQTPSELAAARMAEQIFASPSSTLRQPQQVAIAPLGLTLSPVLQRAISPEMPTIRVRLSTGIFNSVTEKEAHEVLVILKRLRQSSEPDFRDTIAAMEREGLVERLLTSVSHLDSLNEQETLRQIANARVFTRKQRTGSTTVTETVTGSCSPERYEQIYAATMQALGWLDRAITLTDAFLNAPGAAASTSTSQAFNLHFRSTATNIVQHVRARLDHIRIDIRTAPFTVECHGTWDPDCRGYVAYIPGGQPEQVVFCASFFQHRRPQQVETIIHEIAHTQVGGAHITDQGYAAERVLRYLSTAEALTNAESYGLYVEQLATGRTPTMPAPRDTRQDCPNDWWTILQRSIAQAQRVNRNAENVMSNITPGGLQSWTASQRQLLGGNTQSDIDRAKKVFDRAGVRFHSPVDFECEPKGGGRCDRYKVYWYVWGDFHICPSWRALDSDQAWIISLLSGLYGYFRLEGNHTRRRNYARLAYELTQKWWPVLTLPEVLGSPAWRNDDLRIFVSPTLQAIPRNNYEESGRHHNRLSTDMPVYQGPPDFQRTTLPFACKVLFAVDTLAAPRPAPFTPPPVSVLFEFNASQGGFRRSERDLRPDYTSANGALRTTFPTEFNFTLSANGTLHMRFELNDPDSGITRVYDDAIAIDVERIRDIVPSGTTRVA